MQSTKAIKIGLKCRDDRQKLVRQEVKDLLRSFQIHFAKKKAERSSMNVFQVCVGKR